MKLLNKIAVVTGGASGIGEAVVRRFTEAGAKVVFTDTNVTAGQNLAAELEQSFYCRDVASEQDWITLMTDVEAQFGALHILVNNAAVISNQSIADTELASWQRMLDVNLTGAMLGCRSAIPLMQKNSGPERGAIVNISSTVALLGLSNDVGYTATKSALVGLTRSVAAWCAKQGTGIRCNSVHPGTTETPILTNQIAAHPELEVLLCKMSPVNRMAQPREIANLVLYLASDESSYSTGGQFVADGGVTSTHPTMDL